MTNVHSKLLHEKLKIEAKIKKIWYEALFTQNETLLKQIHDFHK